MKEQLLTELENSRNYTLAVAEAMPARLYTTKPVDMVWDFGELLHHIAYGMQWWETNYIRRIETEWDPPVKKTDKKNVRKSLEASYDMLSKTIASIKLSEEKSSGFYATMDYITHHRGQAIIFLRYKGIAPPGHNY